MIIIIIIIIIILKFITVMIIIFLTMVFRGTIILKSVNDKIFTISIQDHLFRVIII